MWQPIATAPFDCDLALAVLDQDGPHALVFPCRRILSGWLKAGTRERIEVHPTHPLRAVGLGHDPEKHALDPIGGGNRFSEKIMLMKEAGPSDRLRLKVSASAP